MPEFFKLKGKDYGFKLIRQGQKPVEKDYGFVLTSILETYKKTINNPIDEISRPFFSKTTGNNFRKQFKFEILGTKRNISGEETIARFSFQG